jgi:hypothetical protein
MAPFPAFYLKISQKWDVSPIERKVAHLFIYLFIIIHYLFIITYAPFIPQTTLSLKTDPVFVNETQF